MPQPCPINLPSPQPWHLKSSSNTQLWFHLDFSSMKNKLILQFLLHGDIQSSPLVLNMSLWGMNSSLISYQQLLNFDFLSMTYELLVIPSDMKQEVLLELSPVNVWTPLLTSHPWRMNSPWPLILVLSAMVYEVLLDPSTMPIWNPPQPLSHDVWSPSWPLSHDW